MDQQTWFLDKRAHFTDRRPGIWPLWVLYLSPTVRSTRPLRAKIKPKMNRRATRYLNNGGLGVADVHQNLNFANIRYFKIFTQPYVKIFTPAENNKNTRCTTIQRNHKQICSNTHATLQWWYQIMAATTIIISCLMFITITQLINDSVNVISQECKKWMYLTYYIQK